MNRNYQIHNLVLLLLLGVVAPLHAQTIRGKIYGGGQLATVDGDTKVQINSGTIGDGEAFNGGVFGGGLGEPTIVTGNVDVIIGKPGSAKDAAGPTINGDVYGGSALGNTNCSVDFIATAEKTTSVDLNAGTINGSMYGGALGQKNGVGGATKDVAANVYGPDSVRVNGGIVLRREGDIGGSYSGGIYGCNNWNGSPQTTVDVDIYHHNTAKDGDKYALFAVYGGGNQANYVAGTPNVTVHYCDNSIEYVYGGGNAAHLTHTTDDGNGNMVGDGNTNVVIWGCDSIGSVFGGGNGQVQAANVSGNTQVTIHGGKILNVFGGSNTNGMIGGATNVNVLAQDEPDHEACYAMEITNVYGGGNKAAGKSGTVSIACTGNGTIENVYGGANEADLTGDITLNITGGQIGNVFGGNNNSGRINGAITVNVDWATGDDACGKNSLTNVYGGGNLAPYYAYGYDDDGKEKNPEDGKVYGPIVNINNGTVSNNVYGGGLGEAAVVTGNPEVNILGGSIGGDVYGGGSLAETKGNPQVKINDGTVEHDVYGGGALAVITGNTLVQLNGGTVMGGAYGGGLGQLEDVENSKENVAANVSGSAQVNLGMMVDDGTGNFTPTGNATVGNIFGCNNVNGAPAAATVTTISGTVTHNVYGGGNQAAATLNPSVNIKGGLITESVFGGGYGTTAVITGNTSVIVNSGTVTKDVYGGGALANIAGNTIVDLLGGTVTGSVYGGGLGDADVAANVIGSAQVSLGMMVDDGTGNLTPTGNSTVGNIFGCNNVNGAPTTATVTTIRGTVTHNVYGGGNQAPATLDPSVTINGGTITENVFGGGLGATAIITGKPDVIVSAGTVSNNVFGGGSEANTIGDTQVTIIGGTVAKDVYGGGALADINGNTNVDLFDGSVGGAYGGGLGAKNGVNGATKDVAALVTGNTTVTLGKAKDGGGYTASKVTGDGIFGANNLNGTPKGHAYVHVLSTTPRDGQGAEEYDVPAVYGGGNLSAYEPTDPEDYAEVLIENCDNSIEYVYGGGNAAPVPATKVVIYGADAINHAFAGGNGAGTGNPGADIGYLGYHSQGSNQEYGTGKSYIAVYGGTVHNVYGGSNTLGYIRKGTEVTVANAPADYKGAACDLNVGNIFGGGNEADIDGDVTITCDCSEGGQILYAGANNADVNGSITLNIHSGTYGQVFCGNNQGGAVKGKLEVNVDETGCWPVMIGELYGGGNMAPYSVYGYDNDGKCIQSADDMTMEKAYKDPQVNLISFTRIGKVFGGGYGATAVLYGNTHVSVEPIKGIFAGKKNVSPLYVLDGSDKRVLLADDTTMPYGITNNGNNTITIAEDAGSIGSIFGGGNAGAVYGNTNVEIGLRNENVHMNNFLTTDKEVAVTITGDVFGGGEKAIVSGNTNVKIGE